MPRGEHDPAGEAVRNQIAQLGHDVGPVRSARVFFLDADLDESQRRQVGERLLADPIVEQFRVVTESQLDAGSRIEVHLKPGVMDPVATSTQSAIADMGIAIRAVSTGRSYAFETKLDRATLETIARRALANGVIEQVHFDTHLPRTFAAASPASSAVRHVAMRELTDDQLKSLSRTGHLFLSLDEMRAVQTYYREQGREPTDIELETIAQTWSEHCVHKTLKSRVEVVDAAGKVVRRYENLIKETIFRATEELMTKDRGSPFALSVFRDNAGVIAFDDEDAVCFKVETHNRPSAIEPYGGAATGIGGCIRDVLGTGRGARPVANTNVFCVGASAVLPPRSVSTAGAAGDVAAPSVRTLREQTLTESLPRGVIHPRRVLEQVVAGVRDYGNRMGIPTVNGAVHFDENYIANPLVFAGCVGIIPRDKITKQVNAGDAVVVLGGRTGRDGIHGATFSSAELTDTHADEFSHAVQIGNAITQKKLADVLLAARDRDLFSAVTDCGAGGLSSAVGEMGEKLGASIRLETVPLKYAGLRYDEIWISEAQERMVLSVPPANVAALLALAKSEDVEATVIGIFGTPNRELVLTFNKNEVGRLSMDFLHDGLPKSTRRATLPRSVRTEGAAFDSAAPPVRTLRETLLAKLAEPNIASKHWIIRQYDHEVQGGSVIKPLVGPHQIGPSDASVVRPKLSSMKGVVLSIGLAPSKTDARSAVICAIDEAIRNAVCVGASLDTLAMLDNFCWPGVDDEETMGTLVAACEACYEASLAYGVPFISGKDSLHNQFTERETGRVIRIPYTMLISTIGVLDDVRKCVTMDFKSAGSTIYLLQPKSESLADLAAAHRAVTTFTADGNVHAAHDVSDGGVLAAVAEMCIASGFGASLTSLPLDAFAEPMGCYVVESAGGLASEALRVTAIGKIDAGSSLRLGEEAWTIASLTAAWRGTLDW